MPDKAEFVLVHLAIGWSADPAAKGEISYSADFNEREAICPTRENTASDRLRSGGESTPNRGRARELSERIRS